MKGSGSQIRFNLRSLSVPIYISIAGERGGKSEFSGSYSAPNSGFKETEVSFWLTRKNSILWGASVIGRYCARHQITSAQISNLMSGEQYHIIHFTILRRFSWPRLDKGGRLTLSSLNLSLSSSSTTSRELLSQFSTCSG